MFLKKMFVERVIAIFLLFLAFAIFSCVQDQNSYKVRLNNFKELLSEEAKENFVEGNLVEVVNFLKEQSDGNEEFSQRLLVIKDFESINFFDDEQVVVYFYENFQARETPE